MRIVYPVQIMGTHHVQVIQNGNFVCEAQMLFRKNSLSDYSVDVLDVSRLSNASERVHPVIALQIADKEGPIFRVQPKATLPSLKTEFEITHDTCIRQRKTIMLQMVQGKELHMVALKNHLKPREPYFWAYDVSSFDYMSALKLLNLRCLVLVFDLDETLIVAHTKRTFDDKIKSLEGLISLETDPGKKVSMLEEKARLEEDRSILWEYYQTDEVTDQGKKFSAQMEEIEPYDNTMSSFFRPVVRLKHKSMILTRIDPKVRDTSVLVRIRPFWEELRDYIFVESRKRFEVFVCTMGEQQYALEMWRLLDPDNKLIALNELKKRIVSVKSSTQKNLINVLRNTGFPPAMAMIVDDRVDVWTEKDKPRVFQLPAFIPYSNPKAESKSGEPSLCTVRNVCVNVRAAFFKEVDVDLLRKLESVDFGVDTSQLFRSLDVGNYTQRQNVSYRAFEVGPPQAEEQLERLQIIESESIAPNKKESKNEKLEAPSTPQVGIPVSSESLQQPTAPSLDPKLKATLDFLQVPESQQQLVAENEAQFRLAIASLLSSGTSLVTSQGLSTASVANTSSSLSALLAATSSTSAQVSETATTSFSTSALATVPASGPAPVPASVPASTPVAISASAPVSQAWSTSHPEIPSVFEPPLILHLPANLSAGLPPPVITVVPNPPQMAHPQYTSAGQNNFSVASTSVSQGVIPEFKAKQIMSVEVSKQGAGDTSNKGRSPPEANPPSPKKQKLEEDDDLPELDLDEDRRRTLIHKHGMMGTIEAPQRTGSPFQGGNKNPQPPVDPRRRPANAPENAPPPLPPNPPPHPPPPPPPQPPARAQQLPPYSFKDDHSLGAYRLPDQRQVPRPMNLRNQLAELERPIANQFMPEGFRPRGSDPRFFRAPAEPPFQAPGRAFHRGRGRDHFRGRSNDKAWEGQRRGEGRGSFRGSFLRPNSVSRPPYPPNT